YPDIKISLKRSEIRNDLVLKSLLCKIEDTDTNFIFKGHGHGHGIGMSQYGARGAARQGKGYKDILGFYFPGTTVEALAINPPTLTAPPSTPKPDEPAEPKPDKPAKPKPDKPTEPKQYATVNVSSSLNVRQGPGTSYRRIGSLRANTKVEILEKSSSWYKIKSSNLIGYVSGQYLQLEQTIKPGSPPSGGSDPS